ncbi:uncharacterized protein LOC141630425 [Silene latifolia]|uniref:uncharacterized protein LOC141630425 n=1 Tax=Silene latifolia TaxID=37657 RepID=UPI003D77148A
MTGERPKDWAQWIPLAEWWYNSNFHSTIGTTSYEVVYGQSPQLHTPYVNGNSAVAAVDRSLTAREECIQMLKFHLKRAQDRMKSQSHKHRTDKEYQVGDLVYIKLKPYRQQLVVYRSCQKLSPRYFGPFEVSARIGKVAYRLKLPEQSKIYPVFHVSQLRKHHGAVPVISVVLMLDDNLQLRAEPIAILERKMMRKGNGAVVYFLLQWSNGTTEDATWELSDDFIKRFPAFQIS